MKKAKPAAAHANVRVVIEAEVARQVRQHARSSMKTEVCGVLIGREEGTNTIVEACIAGVNAAQGGAHVTFTQDTWEHIYQVKDKEYPEARIVGWYHSHPGFGVFLSEHDLFIHQNFFSSPQQVAWVFDPHNDEEGCFGWHNGKIDRIDDVSLSYGQPCGEPLTAQPDDEPAVKIKTTQAQDDEPTWMSIVRQAAYGALFVLLGAAGTFYYINRTAHVLPRGGSAIVIVQNDSLLVVPPEIAIPMLGTMETEMLRRQQIFGRGQNTPPGPVVNDKGKPDAGQK
jgi:proteasome lid subunit RPN8/RPN11